MKNCWDYPLLGMLIQAVVLGKQRSTNWYFMRWDRAMVFLWYPKLSSKLLLIGSMGKLNALVSQKNGKCPTDVPWQHGMMVTKGNHPHGMFFPWYQDQNREKDGCVFGISLVRFLWNIIFILGITRYFTWDKKMFRHSHGVDV